MDPLATRRVHVLVRVAFVWAALIARPPDSTASGPASASSPRLARDQQQKVEEIKAPRGAILDRYGQRLAMSLPAESVFVDPLRVPDLSVAADVLSKVLNLNARDLLANLKSAVDNRRGFLWVKRKITREEAKRLRALDLEWIEFRTESQRFYPNRSLAAHVIGSVDFEEDGNGGIEQSLNDELAGTRRRNAGDRGCAEARIRIQHGERSAARPGRSSHHRFAHSIRRRARTGEDGGAASRQIRQPGGDGPAHRRHPRHGERARPSIRTSRPSPARWPRAKTWPSQRLLSPDRCYKVITLSSALETTRLRPESMINCGNGSINLFGRMIHDHSRYAALSMADVLARSSNIGAINIGLQVGDKNLYEYIRRFGFGKKTGLPLPGESAGMVRPLRVWQKSSIGSVAMGHEIGVTALQLAQACTVIASGGLLIKPRLLHGCAQGGSGSRAEARNRHHDAQHDGRRSDQALRNRPQIRAADRLHLGGQNRHGADLRLSRRTNTRTCTTLRSWDSRR